MSNKCLERIGRSVFCCKLAHGNCNAPSTSSSEYYSLGQWFTLMRGCYKQIQEGETPSCPLLQNQVERLEATGLEWSRNITFKDGLAELAAFKAKQSMVTAMLPKLRQVNITHLVYGTIQRGSSTSRNKKARLLAVHYQRIRLGDLKHWALN